MATTTASAEPSCTTVPMNRHDDSSASAAPAPTGCERLLGRDRLAGEDRLVALEVARRQQPHVGGDDRSDVEVHDVARHQVGDLDAAPASPSRITVTTWRISECIASAARSARYSLTNPRPTDAATITPMISGVEPLADERRHRGRGEQQPQQRAVHLPGEHRPRARVMRDAPRSDRRPRSRATSAVLGPDSRELTPSYVMGRQRCGDLDRRHGGSVEREGRRESRSSMCRIDWSSSVAEAPTFGR